MEIAFMVQGGSQTSSDSLSPIRRVGYIGMGIMGQPMALNLLKAGFDVTVWNRTAEKCQPMVEAGASSAASPRDLADRVEAVLVNVTDTADVEQVLFGEQGVAGGARPGLVVVDHSTISPEATQHFAERLAAQGVDLLDAPVSGGDVGAREGTLSIMVGGPEAVFERCRPLFEAMGKSAVHLGPAGMGQTCKACNQVAVAGALLAVCEAMALARKSGLDLGRMIDVIAGGAGGSWQLANLGPRIARGDDAPGFMIDLIRKDLAIVLQAARAHDLPLNATALADGYFHAAAAQGDGRRGTQAIAHVLERLGHFRYSDEPGDEQAR